MNVTNGRNAAEAGATPHPHAGRVQALAADAARAGRIPGMVVAIANPDGPLHAVAVGFADLATSRRLTLEDQYPWFSMTKIATATGAVRLHADGALDLDLPIGTYLGGYQASERFGHPTTRQLLSHTAGLRNPMPLRWVRPEGEPPDLAQQSRVLARHGRPKRAVGSWASYSNIGYLLVGEVIEAVTGLHVEDYVKAAVLDPLEMGATSYQYEPSVPRAVGYARLPGVLRPALRSVLPDRIVGPQVGRYTSFRPFLVNGAAYGGLVGPVTDAIKLAAAHAAWSEDNHPVLDHEDIDQMRTITAVGRPFDHGLGWFRRHGDATRLPAFVEHYGTGGGFWNAMRLYPTQRLAVVAMANTTRQWEFDRLFDQIQALGWP